MLCLYSELYYIHVVLSLVLAHMALQLIHIFVCRRLFLFDRGGNPNKRNARKETSLHCACQLMGEASPDLSAREECVNMLIQWRSTKINAENGSQQVNLSAQDKVRVPGYFSSGQDEGAWLLQAVTRSLWICLMTRLNYFTSRPMLVFLHHDFIYTP